MSKDGFYLGLESELYSC
jgi:hypothetical protein